MAPLLTIAVPLLAAGTIVGAVWWLDRRGGKRDAQTIKRNELVRRFQAEWREPWRN